MSENTAVAVPGNTGITVQTEEEKLFAKLNGLKVGSLTSVERSKVEEQENYFVRYFIALNSSYRGLEWQDFAQLNEDECDTLARVLLRDTRNTRWMQEAWLFCIPVVGWLKRSYCMSTPDTSSNEGLFTSLRYAICYKKLRMANGAQCFPFEKLREKLEAYRVL